MTYRLPHYSTARRSRENGIASFTGIALVIGGFAFGLLYLAVLGRYGVPWWMGAATYVIGLVSAFLVLCGFLRTD